MEEKIGSVDNLTLTDDVGTETVRVGYYTLNAIAVEYVKEEIKGTLQFE